MFKFMRLSKSFYRIIFCSVKFSIYNNQISNKLIPNYNFKYKYFNLCEIFLKSSPFVLLTANVINLRGDALYYARIGDLNNLSRGFQKADLEKRHLLGWSLFMTAVANRQLKCAKFLIEKGVNVNEKDDYSGALEMSKNLKMNALEIDYIRRNEFSPEFNSRANFQGCTPLHYAVLLDDYEMTALLLNHNADPTTENDKGYTPIQYAKSESIKNLLLSKEEQFLKSKKEKEIEERRRFPLEHRLRTHIVGQEAAIDLVAATIRRKENGWTDDEHPLVFLFLGSSGIGKTEMAKQIANYLHKNDLKKGFIRIDMSEYQQKHEVAKFIGSPPGYVGHEQGGQLTKALTNCPQAVVLFDEVEKAHPDVLTILLQLFDEGRMTDGQGKTIECKKAIFIMTSNLASEEIANHAQKLRIANKSSTDNVEIGREFKEKIMRPILKRHFLRDEFLGRINEMVYFLPFSDSELARLVKVELEIWKGRALEKHGIDLSWDNSVVDYLADGYNIYYGARSIKYEVERRVINELALAHERELFKSGSKIHLVLNKKFAKAELSDVNQKVLPDPPKIKMIITDKNSKKTREFELGSWQKLWS